MLRMLGCALLHPGTRDIHLTPLLSRTGSLPLAAIAFHMTGVRPDPSARLRTPLVLMTPKARSFPFMTQACTILR